MRRLHPEQAGERAAEEAALPPVEADGLSSLPLFVLEPLLPGQAGDTSESSPRHFRLERLPKLTFPTLQVMQLNVFEPRYLLMMERRLRWIQGSAECRGTEPKDGYLGAVPLRAATQAQLRHDPEPRRLTHIRMASHD